MNFWYSGEIDSEVDDAFHSTRKTIEERLNTALAGNDYGAGVTKIAIIPIILGPRFPNHSERRLLQRSQHSADYRLRIDFETFRRGGERTRELLLIRNTIQAIEDISRKTEKANIEFSGKALKQDVLAAFAISMDDLASCDAPPIRVAGCL